jgi:hypothetical protein
MNGFVHPQSTIEHQGDSHDAASPEFRTNAVVHVLRTLTEHVPMLERSQIDSVLQLNLLTKVTARSTLHKLVEDGWLERYTLLVSAFGEVHSAMFYWTPHERCPDFKSLRESARRQLGAQTTSTRQVYIASRFTANLYGTDYQGAVLMQRCAEWLRWAQVYLRKMALPAPADNSWEPDGVFDSAGNRGGGKVAVARFSQSHSVASIALLTHCSTRQLYLLQRQCWEASQSLELW